jgi:hypothetical protein
MEKAVCPLCRKKGQTNVVEIGAITNTGVAFKCPVHGFTGMRHDSMDEQDREALKLEPPQCKACG